MDCTAVADGLPMDAEDAVAAPVAADPTGFGGDLPTYEVRRCRLTLSNPH